MGPVKNHWELAGAVRGNSRDLGYAVGDAITAIVKDGRMKAICAKYGVAFTLPPRYGINRPVKDFSSLSKARHLAGFLVPMGNIFRPALV